jgi:BON domain
MAEEYGWGFEGRRDGWHRQVPRNEGSPENVSTNPWGEQGRGFVDHSWEPGGRYDQESGRPGYGPQGWERTSDSLRNEICEILTRHGQIDASGVRVTVDNGEVTLEGTVGSRREKRLAEQLLDLVHGLKDVHNRLRIEESGGD